MHIWLHTLLHEKHVDTCLPLSDILTSSGQRLASGATLPATVSLCCAIWKSSTNLWINLMMTSSETAIFSRMEPHATPRMRARPKSKTFLMTGYFESLMAANISWLKSARFFPVGRLKRKSLCQQATHHTRNWKTTFDVKLPRLVRTSCRPLSQTRSVAFSSAWTVVANISCISSSIDILPMKQGI